VNSRICIFISDGRFHIESVMIRNPFLRFFQYDPYSKKFTEEKYDNESMVDIRSKEIEKAKQVEFYGIILGTLGRQGSVDILGSLRELMKKHEKKFVVILLSEITPAKIKLFGNRIGAWIQVACPRLSVDWGHFFTAPMLNSYEAFVMLSEASQPTKNSYPMDYYSNEGGKWSSYYTKNKEREEKLKQRKLAKQQKVKVEYEN
jgi:2-(3-amino-3-carboxypropyl)histidine synthase